MLKAESADPSPALLPLRPCLCCSTVAFLSPYICLSFPANLKINNYFQNRTWILSIRCPKADSRIPLQSEPWYLHLGPGNYLLLCSFLGISVEASSVSKKAVFFPLAPSGIPISNLMVSYFSRVSSLPHNKISWSPSANVLYTVRSPPSSEDAVQFLPWGMKAQSCIWVSLFCLVSLNIWCPNQC